MTDDPEDRWDVAYDADVPEALAGDERYVQNICSAEFETIRPVARCLAVLDRARAEA